MDSKKEFVKSIVNAESWTEYSPCMKECMNIFSIISEVNTALSIRCFLKSYGDTIKYFGNEVLFHPKEVRDEFVGLINDEIKKDHDTYVTYKLITAIVLLGGEVKINADSATFKLVYDLFNCIDKEKISSNSLYMAFQKLKGIKL